MSSERSRYEMLLPLAVGGMAAVYVGRVRGASGFSRLVAIKRPHAVVGDDPQQTKQFEHEAHVASMIHHPNVVAVLDVENVDGDPFLVMDYVEGCSLKDLYDRAAEEELDLDGITVRIALDVAAGLHAAHSLNDADGDNLGVVHRDVSPHNVLVGIDGVARLADFGIAKMTNADQEKTTDNVLKGKLAYLPPEYIDRRCFDRKSDLYSLGVVVWEGLARRRLFKGATTTETVLNVLSSVVPRLGAIRAELEPLEEPVASALERRPEDRPESVEAFARALEARARSTARVATHAEVGALVQRVAGVQLAERRRLIEAAAPRSLKGWRQVDSPPSKRDEMMTESLVAPASAPKESRSQPPKRRRVALVVALLVVALAIAIALQIRAPQAPAAMEVTPLAQPEEPASASAAPPPPPSPSPMATAAEEVTPARPTHRPRVRTSRPVAQPSTSSSWYPPHPPPNPYEK